MKRNEWKARLDDALAGMAENPALCRQVLRRAQQKEETNVKKKIPIGVIIAAAVILAAMSAAAAAVSGWDVLQFLFADQNQAPDLAYTAVSQEAASDGAALRVESAVYDGRMLAFDYSLENKQPDSPMYCRVEALTANGARVWTDGVDDFDEQWLPGAFSDGVWQDGEVILLPEEVRGAEELHVVLTVALYRPTRPVYRMEEFDAAEAQKKAREGYYVIAEGEGFVGYDAEEGQWTRWFMGPLPADMGEYRVERLSLSFDLVKHDHGFRSLQTQEIYENHYCAARYETAELTPLGLYLTLNVRPKDDAVRRGPVDVTLTDGDGNPLTDRDADTFFPTAGDVLSTVDHESRLARFCWAGITAEDLPDVIFLSWTLPDGEQMIFPVRMRADGE